MTVTTIASVFSEEEAVGYGRSVLDRVDRLEWPDVAYDVIAAAAQELADAVNDYDQAEAYGWGRSDAGVALMEATARSIPGLADNLAAIAREHIGDEAAGDAANGGIAA
jgi:hypothetical protein